jgi:hypothetical protein
MPSILGASPPGQGFAGLASIYQFTNEDGLNPDNVCGLAACATLLAYCGLLRPEIASLREIEANHPPDLFFGKLGTSPLRIQAILEAYGADTIQKVNTVDALTQWVDASWPVICLIQNTGGLFGLKDGAHWFVAFAYDDDGVFVTNYGDPCHLSWSDFEERWDSPLATLASVDFKGITNASRSAGGGPPA